MLHQGGGRCQAGTSAERLVATGFPQGGSDAGSRVPQLSHWSTQTSRPCHLAASLMPLVIFLHRSHICYAGVPRSALKSQSTRSALDCRLVGLHVGWSWKIGWGNGQDAGCTRISKVSTPASQAD